MPLTDTALKKAKASEKPFRMFDERGLYLEVSPAGGKWWRFKYRHSDKEKRLSLGVYPDVSLKGARDLRDEARKLLVSGIDPSANRKATKAAASDRAANSFEVVAREWFGKFSPEWAPNHSARVLRLFERDIFPWLGKRSIAEVTAPELLAAIRRIEGRGALDTAHRARGSCSQVFRYAIATGRCDRDPSADLRGALPPAKKGHFAATTEPQSFGGIMRALDGYEGTPEVRCALRLAPLVFVRPGELRHAEWKDIDLDSAEWRYKASKNGPDHIVPQSRGADALGIASFKGTIVAKRSLKKAIVVHETSLLRHPGRGVSRAPCDKSIQCCSKLRIYCFHVAFLAQPVGLPDKRTLVLSRLSLIQYGLIKLFKNVDAFAVQAAGHLHPHKLPLDGDQSIGMQLRHSKPGNGALIPEWDALRRDASRRAQRNYLRLRFGWQRDPHRNIVKRQNLRIGVIQEMNEQPPARRLHSCIRHQAGRPLNG
jgi:Arm DNA-binding domain